jgi:hypothetical protein
VLLRHDVKQILRDAHPNASDRRRAHYPLLSPTPALKTSQHLLLDKNCFVLQGSIW